MMHSRVKGIILEADLTEKLHHLIDAFVPEAYRGMVKRVLVGDWDKAKAGIMSHKHDLEEIVRLIGEIEKEEGT